MVLSERFHQKSIVFTTEIILVGIYYFACLPRIQKLKKNSKGCGFAYFRRTPAEDVWLRTPTVMLAT